MNRYFDLLLPYLRASDRNSEADGNESGSVLLVADENLHDVDFAQIDKNTVVLSNRFEIAQAATTAGLQTYFNDFDFSVLPSGYFKRICYRISKERSVVEHIINQSFHYLSTNGELVLCGAKREGIVRFAGRASEHFNSDGETKKKGLVYTARIAKTDASIIPAQATDNRQYEQLIPVTINSSLTLYTTAGSYGADKVDRGSTMLVEYLETFLDGFNIPPTSLLDLGCGYGYIAICASQLGISRIVATDNCAGAIVTCGENFRRMEISGEVVADDCAANIVEQFDAIVCNPPFHQGFKTDTTLAVKFVQAAFNRLKPKGKALFVVNQFVPLEKAAMRIFAGFTVIRQAHGFKLITMDKR
jgi:16S rRNA (guanine1207-N2)-methyltransferase